MSTHPIAKIQDHPVQLAPPGGRVPPLEMAWLRWFGKNMPHFVPRAMMLRRFHREEERLRRIAESLADAGSKRTLIPRFMGIEDNSRYWSGWMVVEHLAIVNEFSGRVVQALLRNEEPPTMPFVGVKPGPLAGPEVLERFDQVNQSFAATVRSAASLESENRHPHFWFGPLSPRQWIFFVEWHMSVHRVQIQKIADRIG